MTTTLRIANPESETEKLHRLKWENKRNEFRSEKRERTRAGAAEDVGIANVFRDLGIDYFLAGRDQAFKLVPKSCEGRRVDGLSPISMKFLKENYDIEQVVGSGDKLLLHFTHGGTIKMSIISDVAKRTELPSKTIKLVYHALVRQIHHDLRENRKCRLPELGILKVIYKPARKGGGKVKNPFKKGEMMTIKARDASNKLKFRISKDLRVYVDEKVKVVKPKD